MADIVSLTGAKLTPPGIADENVVAVAREVLERALAGDINGLCVSMRNFDGAHQHRVAGEISIGTIGDIEMMKLELIDQLK